MFQFSSWKPIVQVMIIKWNIKELQTFAHTLHTSVYLPWVSLTPPRKLRPNIWILASYYHFATWTKDIFKWRFPPQSSPFGVTNRRAGRFEYAQMNGGIQFFAVLLWSWEVWLNTTNKNERKKPMLHSMKSWLVYVLILLMAYCNPPLIWVVCHPSHITQVQSTGQVESTQRPVGSWARWWIWTRLTLHTQSAALLL